MTDWLSESMRMGYSVTFLEMIGCAAIITTRYACLEDCVVGS